MKHTVLTSDGMERNIEKSIPIVFRTMRKKFYIKYTIYYTYDTYCIYIKYVKRRTVGHCKFDAVHKIVFSDIRYYYTVKVYGSSRKEKRLARIYDVYTVRTRNVRKFGGVGKKKN
jgi:hypothetical protein